MASDYERVVAALDAAYENGWGVGMSEQLRDDALALLRQMREDLEKAVRIAAKVRPSHGDQDWLSAARERLGIR